jgi:hypothetical protein
MHSYLEQGPRLAAKLPAFDWVPLDGDREGNSFAPISIFNSTAISNLTFPRMMYLAVTSHVMRSQSRFGTISFDL